MRPQLEENIANNTEDTVFNHLWCYKWIGSVSLQHWFQPLDRHLVEISEVLTVLFHCQYNHWTLVYSLMQSRCWSSAVTTWRTDPVILWRLTFCSRLVSNWICNGQCNASSAKGGGGSCTTHQFRWFSDGVRVPLLASLRIPALEKGKNLARLTGVSCLRGSSLGMAGVRPSNTSQGSLGK